MLLSPVIIAQRLTRISSHPQPCRQGSAGENRAGSRSWACDIEAAWEQAISGQDYGRSEVSRKRAGSGENSRKGSRPAVGRSQVAATSQQHGASDLFRGRPGLCRSSRGRLKPSNAAPGAGCAVITRVQGFASVPKREVGGRFERETGGKEGKWSQSCEHFGERVGSGKVAGSSQKGSHTENGVIRAGGGRSAAASEQAVRRPVQAA